MMENGTGRNPVNRPSIPKLIGDMWQERSDRFLYNNLFNDFFWLGLGLGATVPVGLLTFQIYLENRSLFSILRDHPVHFFFLALPLFSSFAFSLVGSSVTHLFRRMREDSIHDYLTGLYGHRYFREELKDRLAEASRYDYPLSVLIFDLDHFKDINDQHGHPTGDRVLQTIAGLMKTQSRSADVVCRYGGEEIVLILPHTKKSGAVNVAERIRRTIASHDFEDSISVTVSGGFPSFPRTARPKTN